MKNVLFTLVLFIMTAMCANSQNQKVLVVYYSWGGNTRDYSECVAQARKETKADFRPAIKTKVENMKDYDVILVGTPNWCSTIAPPLATFLKENDFEGKTVALFVTHGGGGLSRCETDMRKLAGNAKFLKSGVFAGSSVASSDDDIAKWLKEISLKK